MADKILAAVAVQRELIEGEGVQQSLGELISRFASGQLYRRPEPHLDKLRRQIMRQLTQEYLPLAQRVGRESARPLLDALGGDRMVQRGLAKRGRIFEQFRTYHRNNLRVLQAELQRELGTLSGDVKAAFARAHRDGVARKQLIDDLVQADRGELKRLADVRKEIAKTRGNLKVAESKAAKASKRKLRRARREVRGARKQLTKAKAKVGTAKTFYARFETRVQGHVRDAVRREAQRAQHFAFKRAGYTEFTWVAVNGTDACPSCEFRHGFTQTEHEWGRDGMPGDGATYCKAACMCQLVPKPYTEGNPSLAKPLDPNMLPPAPMPGWGTRLRPVRG